MSDKKTTPTRDELVEMLDAIFTERGTEELREEYFLIIERSVPHPRLDSLFDLHEWKPDDIIDNALAYVPVVMKHPLLDKLKELSKKASSMFSENNIRSLDDVGFAWFMDDYLWGGYEVSPLNSVSFACTGGDGDHFSFLVRNNSIDENSPIIYSSPTSCSNVVFGENFIVGENLFDFLCFGMHCGYFQPLSVLDYADDYVPEDSAKITLLDTGKSTWFGDEVWEEMPLLLTWLSNELELTPWENRTQRFNDLQEKYLPLLEIAPNDY